MTPLKTRPFCAAKEIRTPMPLRALPPQGSASTNFAIAADRLQITAKKIVRKTLLTGGTYYQGFIRANF